MTVLRAITWCCRPGALGGNQLSAAGRRGEIDASLPCARDSDAKIIMPASPTRVCSPQQPTHTQTTNEPGELGEKRFLWLVAAEMCIVHDTTKSSKSSNQSAPFLTNYLSEKEERRWIIEAAMKPGAWRTEAMRHECRGGGLCSRVASSKFRN